jgi:hypothetical protein
MAGSGQENSSHSAHSERFMGEEELLYPPDSNLVLDLEDDPIGRDGLIALLFYLTLYSKKILS